MYEPRRCSFTKHPNIVFPELPRGDCFADSTPLGFNTLLQGAAHLGRLTGFACKSFSIRDLTEGKADLPFSNKIGISAYQPLYI